MNALAKLLSRKNLGDFAKLVSGKKQNQAMSLLERDASKLKDAQTAAEWIREGVLDIRNTAAAHRSPAIRDAARKTIEGSIEKLKGVAKTRDDVLSRQDSLKKLLAKTERATRDAQLNTVAGLGAGAGGAGILAMLLGDDE